MPHGLSTGNGNRVALSVSQRSRANVLYRAHLQETDRSRQVRVVLLVVIPGNGRMMAEEAGPPHLAMLPVPAMDDLLSTPIGCVTQVDLGMPLPWAMSVLASHGSPTMLVESAFSPKRKLYCSKVADNLHPS